MSDQAVPVPTAAQLAELFHQDYTEVVVALDGTVHAVDEDDDTIQIAQRSLKRGRTWYAG